MAEYNQRIDEQISDVLRRSGRVTCDDLAGLAREETGALLARYVEIHRTEAPLVFDGAVITWTVSAFAGPPAADSVAALSPVDQVLSAPTGKALLDTAPAGPPVGRGFWLLPLMLGALGGLLAWLVVREQNPRVARQLLLTGLVVQLIAACVAAALATTMAGFGRGSAEQVWTTSASGRPEFHYFATPT